LRPVHARELQDAIPSPPRALVPRVSTVATWILALRLRSGSATSHPPHALEAAQVALAGKQGQADGDGHGH